MSEVASAQASLTLPQIMNAELFYEPGVLRNEQVPTPRPDSGEAVIKVGVVLTCGTDLKIYRRGHPLVKPPQILGHEFTGTVVKTGPGVKRFKPGDKIVAVNSAPCRRCYYCKHGQPNLCSLVKEQLLGFSLPGAYAEYVRIPRNILSQNTYPLPKDVPEEEMALLEPLADAVQGSDVSEMKRGDSVAILGGGPMGLIHLAVAKARGAGRVICIDNHESKLELARQLGADITVAAHGVGAVETVRDVTEGRGADVVIEATGRPEAWSRSFDMVRQGGIVVFFGGCPSGTVITFHAGKLHYGNVTLRGSFHHTPKSVKSAFSLLTRRKIRLTSLITGRMKISEAEEALQMMARGEALKIALTL